MALIAMTTADTIDYVSNLDPCKTSNVPAPGEKPVITIKEGATTFKLRSLDVFLMGHIWDSASVLRGTQGSDEVGIHTQVNKTNIEAVRHGLVGFENFSDAKGSPVKFQTAKAMVNGRLYDVVEDSILNMLGIKLIQELGLEIKRISEVTAAEAKN